MEPEEVLRPKRLPVHDQRDDPALQLEQEGVAAEGLLHLSLVLRQNKVGLPNLIVLQVLGLVAVGTAVPLHRADLVLVALFPPVLLATGAISGAPLGLRHLLLRLPVFDARGLHLLLDGLLHLAQDLRGAPEDALAEALYRAPQNLDGLLNLLFALGKLYVHPVARVHRRLRLLNHLMGVLLDGRPEVPELLAPVRLRGALDDLTRRLLDVRRELFGHVEPRKRGGGFTARTGTSLARGTPVLLLDGLLLRGQERVEHGAPVDLRPTQYTPSSTSASRRDTKTPLVETDFSWRELQFCRIWFWRNRCLRIGPSQTR